MKVNEVVTEVADTYFNSLSNKLSAMGFHDAIARGYQDSRLRGTAKDWLERWNEKLSSLKKIPNQTVLTTLLQKLAYSDMQVTPSNEADKAIQELVDLSVTKRSDTGVALKYMTRLMTLSLIQPTEEKQTVEYGDYLPNDMMQTGKVVPVKFVIAGDDSTWVKFNGDWYRDVDDSDLQVQLHNEPANDSYGRLENMRGRNIPMRVGQTGTRTLEFLHKRETEDWFKEYE